MNEWIYFGCHRQPGHHLFGEGMRPFGYSQKLKRLTSFDGMLPPQDNATPYIATVSRLEGFGMSALAFWDYSVDGRGGCNSVVFAPSLTIEPDDFLAEAQMRFPEVFGRLPQSVQLLLNRLPERAVQRHFGEL